MDAIKAQSRLGIARRSSSLVSLKKQGWCEDSFQVRTPKSRGSGPSNAAVQASLASPPTASPREEPLSLSMTRRRTSWEEPTLRSPSEWLSALAPEIVSRVEQAPFFHLAFDQEPRTELRRVEPADVTNSDSWPQLCRRMMTSNPDAVVFVHELDSDSEDEAGSSDFEDPSVAASLVVSRPGSKSLLCRDFNATKTWGLVFLGRGYKHSCYILRTSKVFSPAGATTHFSLTKAKCFAPSLHEQMEQAWLVGNQ